MHVSIGVIFFFSFTIVMGTEKKNNFKVVVPEFICERKGYLGNQHGKTKIGLLGGGKIDFQLAFKRIARPCRNTQRCNLIIWKSIREFEKYLNNYPHTDSNYIEFDNTMLLPGYNYILKVATKEGTRNQQQVSFKFVDENYVESSSKPLVSLILIGISSIEPHMTYILNAEVNICSGITDFYFHWQLLDGKSNLLQTFPDRSTKLIIPPFTFQSKKSYVITSGLVNMETNMTEAKAKHHLDVEDVKESLIVKLPVIYTTIKVQQEFNIKAYVVDLANYDEDINKRWSCIYTSNAEDHCKDQTGDGLYIQKGFINEGEYTVSLMVTKGSESKSSSCLVRVLKEVPSIEIDVPERLANPSTGVRITAGIYGLKTFCTVQWKSVEGLYFFDLSSVPGNMDEIHHVFAKRDLFLHEIEEFSKDVVNKEYNLVIPSPSGDWKGLPIVDKDYKLHFLLEVTCPKVQLEENDIEIEYSNILNHTVTISAMVEVEVTMPPKLQALQVMPESGVALETIFRFEIQNTDHQVLYKFGYISGDREFVFSELLGVAQADTFLPFGEHIQTFVEACNVFASCGKVFGPIIETTLPETIDEDALNIFREAMNTEDFYKGFWYAASVLNISEVLNEEKPFSDQFSEEIYNKIKYLLNTYTDHGNWEKRTNKLISTIKDFSDDITYSDNVLNGLIELREKLVIKKEKLILRRNLLASDEAKMTVENFKSYIDVSELIITHLKNKNKVAAEKELLTNRVTESLGIFCSNLYEQEQIISLEFKSFILRMEKLPKRFYDMTHTITFDKNPWNTKAEIKIYSELLENDKGNLCIAKMLFTNFFNKTGITYGVNILNGAEKTILNNIQSTVLMPLNQSKPVDATPEVTWSTP